MQGASSSVRALCVSQPADSNGWPVRVGRPAGDPPQCLRTHDVLLLLLLLLLLPGSCFRWAEMARVLDKSIKR